MTVLILNSLPSGHRKFVYHHPPLLLQHSVLQYCFIIHWGNATIFCIITPLHFQCFPRSTVHGPRYETTSSSTVHGPRVVCVFSAGTKRKTKNKPLISTAGSFGLKYRAVVSESKLQKFRAVCRLHIMGFGSHNLLRA